VILSGKAHGMMKHFVQCVDVEIYTLRRMKKMMSNKEIKKYVEIVNRAKIMCDCGHRVIMPPHFDKVICNWCGNYVFRDKKTEFEYRMNEEMRRNK
jgi:ribosomal protein S27AE